MDWSKVEKRVQQGSLLSPWLLNFYSKFMQNARLDEAQSEIKIPGRSISNLRYSDDTTLMAEREEQLKSLLMKVKEESEKAGLKLNILKMKIMASGLVLSCHWKWMGKQCKQWQTSFSQAPKSLQIVTSGKKLEDACSLDR